MGMIGRWIDEKCAEEPEVMRRVLGRKFGRLLVFIDDTMTTRCGCLVGSWAIESGRFGEHEDSWEFRPRLSSDDLPTFEVGVNVYHLTRLRGSHYAERKRSDLFVIRLLKQRIRKALGLALNRKFAVGASSVSVEAKP